MEEFKNGVGALNAGAVTSGRLLAGISQQQSSDGNAPLTSSSRKPGQALEPQVGRQSSSDKTTTSNHHTQINNTHFSPHPTPINPRQ
jgi:hypothetical protein